MAKVSESCCKGKISILRTLTDLYSEEFEQFSHPLHDSGCLPKVEELHCIKQMDCHVTSLYQVATI